MSGVGHTPWDLRSDGGRSLVFVGDPDLLTAERLTEFTNRIDSDPRIASLSLVAMPASSGQWLRAAGPAGPLTAIASDLEDLVGPVNVGDPEAIEAWMTEASERGLWHDWWLTDDGDVFHAESAREPRRVDIVEAQDPSSSRHHARRAYAPEAGRLSVTIDVAWLGPHETGAQVLTTSAIDALARQEEITAVRLVGLDELPTYAKHLTEHQTVQLVQTDEAERSDVVWYPNQIDGRGTMDQARDLGARVIVSYLDLIAYDIPRYHASPEAWHAYRALQRKVALTVDGITTISADVAKRLIDEVPRLDPDRVEPILLGLDHITAERVPDQPDEDLADAVESLKGKRFVVVLGNDFQHKNRDFAIKVWQRTLEAGESCDLVLAGLHVKGSSSRDAEDDLRARHLNLRGSIHTVGHVSSTSREWLLANAAVVLYPSSAEGFGFVPYEAATLGTPTVFTDFGPLKEVAQVPDLPGTWSVEAYADDLTDLLTSEEAAIARVTALAHASKGLTWGLFATHLVEFFRRITLMPQAPTSSLAGESGSDAAALASVLSSRSYRAAAKLQRVVRGRRY